mmetsp:Transcript_28999/g.72864  ORF Transcript_28999/g.72864 Transcript_28999/m.72864 type:complete len:420 (-) Transcript_28999:132-1391(-)
MSSEFKPIPVTASGRPQLAPEEIETAYAAAILEDIAPAWGTLTVTTHRVIFTLPSDPKARPAARSVPLFSTFSFKTKPSLRAHKATLTVRVPAPKPPEGTATPSNAPSAAAAPPATRGDVVVRFRSPSERDAILSAFSRARADKAWERLRREKKAAAEKSAAVNAVDVTRHAGIGGLLEREARKQAVAGEAMAAFGDLDRLMAGARELVGLAGRLAAVDAEAARAGGKEVEEGKERLELAKLMEGLGIASPVTKGAAGGNQNTYQTQLARQLAEFLPKPLEYHGGVMTLVDVYCLYNRARSSTELVAPDDLVAACKLCESLRLGVRLTTLSSSSAKDGRLPVMELDSFRGAARDRRLLKAAEDAGGAGIAAEDMVRGTYLPVGRAVELLKASEAAGVLCRDEAPGGAVRFFPNWFATRF